MYTDYSRRTLRRMGDDDTVSSPLSGTIVDRGDRFPFLFFHDIWPVSGNIGRDRCKAQTSP